MVGTAEIHLDPPRNPILQIHYGDGFLLGSQNKSFSFNAPPTKHASCRAAPKPGLF
jgi:hypothetical protein